MRVLIAKCQKNATVLRRLAVVTAITGATIAGVASPAQAHTQKVQPHIQTAEEKAKKATLLSLYRQWVADKQRVADKQSVAENKTGNKTTGRAQKINIEPAGIKTKKSLKRVNLAARKPVSDEITDAEIFAQSQAEANDPFEPLNRLIFGFNEILDLIILTPVAKTYRFVVPSPVRTGVSNAIANAKAPVTFANDLLQGKPRRAQTTLMRFLINTTVGLGGFVDAAEAGGFEKHSEDFGQTLAVWGVGSGPYLVVPVFGPSSPRRIIGRVVDTAATPTTWALADFSLLERSTPTIAELVSGRETLLDDVEILRTSSPDFYASVRDIYRQSRKNAIFDGELGVDPIPDLPADLPLE